MGKVQYTLSAIPETVDLALRRQTRRKRRSLNAIAVETLARGLELDVREPANADLDDLVGSWVGDPGFDLAQDDFSRPEPADGT